MESLASLGERQRKSPTVISNEVLHETLERIVPDRKERIAGWLTQPYYEKGKAEGKAEGEARVLARLLEKRFGDLPASVRRRLFTADVAAIESWVERAFDAPDLHSIFGPNLM